MRAPSMLLALALAACGSDAGAPPDVEPARLTLVSVDTIPDPTGQLLGRFSSALITRDSTILVPVQYANHIVQLDADGRLMRRIGRHGSGPGEFSYSPQDLAEWGDSLVFVNLSTRMVSFFHRADGRYLDRHVVGGFPYSLAATPAQLFVGAISVEARTAAGVFARGDSVMRQIVPIPEALAESPLALSRWPVSVVAAVQDTVFVAFVVSNWVQEATATGKSIGSFRIPAVRRRPVPFDLERQLEPIMVSRRAFGLFALLGSMTTRTDGSLLAVHQDWFLRDTTDRPFVDGETIDDSLVAYASVIDRANRRACVDTPIPLDWASLPAAVSVHGDDIVILGHVNDGSPAAVLEFRRYRVDLSSCGWLPID